MSAPRSAFFLLPVLQGVFLMAQGTRQQIWTRRTVRAADLLEALDSSQGGGVTVIG